MGLMDGHVALVTGAAGGIGEAAAAALKAAGANVILADIDEARLAATAERMGAAHLCLDVTSRASWEEAVAATVQRLGRLSVLVNNAGISEPGDIETVTEDSWNRHLAINLTGVMLGMQVAAPALRASALPAAIVNVASMLSLRPGAPFAAYCAAKAGMVALSQSAALHFARSGAEIRVNTVHPGAILTPMLERYTSMDPNVSRDEALAAFAANHPMGRVGEAEEVAQAILWLASPLSSFTTGAMLPVDGAGHIRD